MLFKLNSATGIPWAFWAEVGEGAPSVLPIRLLNSSTSAVVASLTITWLFINPAGSPSLMTSPTLGILVLLPIWGGMPVLPRISLSSFEPIPATCVPSGGPSVGVGVSIASGGTGTSVFVIGAGVAAAGVVGAIIPSKSPGRFVEA